MTYIDMQKIAEIMEEKDITFGELAVRIGVAEEELENWFSLSDISRFDDGCFLRLAVALETSVKELLIKED